MLSAEKKEKKSDFPFLSYWARNGNQIKQDLKDWRIMKNKMVKKMTENCISYNVFY